MGRGRHRQRRHKQKPKQNQVAPQHKAQRQELKDWPDPGGVEEWDNVVPMAKAHAKGDNRKFGRAGPEKIDAIAQEMFGGRYYSVRKDMENGPPDPESTPDSAA